MDHFATWAADDNNDDDVGRLLGANSPRDTTIQIVLSATLGISAFLAFCFLRPRWTGLYAARKVQKDEATALPNLPDTFFGWILPLWRITDQQVLASAGLDAYVFLAFFKMAIKFLAITLFFSLVVIKPVHDAYPEDEDTTHGNKTSHHNSTKGHDGKKGSLVNLLESSVMSNHSRPSFSETFENDYLWMYLAFAYLFTTIIIYLIISETRRIIEVRQEYLGTQTTATDRTIRLSGIPAELQEETKIKEFVESLDIGKVESVFLVRKIGELDEAMAARMVTLRKLEEAYVIHAARRTVEQNLGALPVVQPPEPLIDHVSEEDDGSPQDANGHSAPAPLPQTVRPTTTIRFGFLKMHSKQVDAIAYYETMLKEQDERVMELRKQHFDPTSLAFVTMDSVAACQMAIQAVLDPSPLSLIANQSPAPSDIIWPNTYLSRRSRMFRSWSVTALIVLLTIFWSVIFVPIAGLLNTDTIGKIFPQIGTFLEDHKNARSLVNTQLPTLIASLLTVLVPYMYYYLSWYQGMIAQGDIELSAISKNFFFTFFNFFVIFTVLGTASKFYQFFERFGDAIQDPSRVAYTLAQSLQRLLTFYVNFIILQGIGLFPFRLLEIGSVSLYPLFLMGAKTPRGTLPLPFESCVCANTPLRRLRRARATTDVHLQLLPPHRTPNLHHLPRLQRPPRLVVCPPRRPRIFPPWPLRVQVPAPLRHGPSTAVHRSRVGYDLRPHLPRPCLLPAHDRRPAHPDEGRYAQLTAPPTRVRHHLDQRGVWPDLQATYAIHCSAECKARRALH